MIPAMNIFYRIMLAVYAFCLMIMSAISMIITLRRELSYRIFEFYTGNVLQNFGSRLAMFIISLVFFVLSLVFLLSGFKKSKEKRAVSKYTNIGEVKISLNSIENIALSAAKKNTSIREAKAYVYNIAEGVLVIMRIVALPDVNLPSLSEDIQTRVKNAIEECSGINVDEVKVFIENIHTGYKSRVE